LLFDVVRLMLWCQADTIGRDKEQIAETQSC